MDDDLSRPMELLLQSKSPQFNLLTADRFIDYLEGREIRISKEELGFFEKTGVVVPVLRLIQSKGESGFYSGAMHGSYSLQKAFKDGAARVPRAGKYVPWEEYKDGYQDKVITFYHPYQIIPLRHFENSTRFLLTAAYFSRVNDPAKSFETMKNYTDVRIKSIQGAVPVWNKRIGLLMLLQQAYGLEVEGWFHANPFDQDNSFNQWKVWRQREFSPGELLKQSGLTVEEARSLYELMVMQASSSDPLMSWFVLTRLVTRTEIRNLQGKALLAQEYYDVSRMVARFIEDLTKEKQPDPDDLMNGRDGSWKEVVFAKPFDYSRQETRKAIVDHYLQEPTLRYLLMYEGETEETVINMIFDAVYFNPEKQGVMLYNYGGTGGLDGRNAASMLALAANQSVPVFVISDNDEGAESNISELVNARLLKPDMYHIWKGDFEQENFGVEGVLSVVNQKLVESYPPQSLSTEEVGTEVANGKPLMKAVHDICYVRLRVELGDIISKPELARRLMEERAKEIREERNKGGWKPKLPIEHTLQKALGQLAVK